jgi:PAS domain S-box-containing protein
MREFAGAAAAPPRSARETSHQDGSQTQSGASALDTALLFRVAENAPVAIAVVEGHQHRFIYANPLYRRLNPALGAGMIGRPIREVFPDVDAEGIALIDQVYATGKAIKLRGRVSKAIPDRPNSVWNVDLVPLAAESGDVQAVLLMLQDVTPLVEARAKAEDRARDAEDSRRILDGLIRCIPEGIAIADANDVTLRSVSALACTMTGRSWAELQGSTAKEHAVRWGVLRPDGTRPDWDELPLNRAVLTGELVTDEEWALECPDGRRLAILCNAAPIRDRAGTIIGGVAAWRDITAMKRADEARIAAEESLQVALQAAGMATWDFDLAHDTPLGSLRLEQIFGYPEPVRDWGPREILHHVVEEDQAAVAAQFEAAARGEMLAFQCRIRRADTGVVQWIAMKGETYRDERGKPMRLAGVIQDVTVTYRDERGKPMRLAGVIQDVTATKLAEEKAERAAQAVKEDIQYRYNRLTQRQQAVMTLIVAGHANKEVAYRLGIAERTVEGHRARVMERMCVRDFASLVRMAATLGLGEAEQNRTNV